jgi:uncharacterized protein YbbC (DUF1343 family)
MLVEPRRFLAVRAAVEILTAIRDLFPHAIDIASVSELDRDWGTDSLRTALLAGRSADQILAQWSADVARFEQLRRKYLLY